MDVEKKDQNKTENAAEDKFEDVSHDRGKEDTTRRNRKANKSKKTESDVK